MRYMLFVVRCSLLVTLFLTGCTVNLPGSGARTRTVKKAVAEVIDEAKTESVHTGQIEGTVTLNIDNKPITGTVKAELKGSSKGTIDTIPKPDSVAKKKDSLIIELVNLFGWTLLLTIFLIWFCTRVVGGIFKRIAKRSVSFFITGCITLGYLWFSDINWVDILGVNIGACILTNYVYDVYKNKDYKEFIGIKNKKDKKIKG